MKVTLERLPQSRVQLEIEVDPERVERSLDAAYRRIVRRTKIPGFRPGKAPRAVVERLVGREGLLREALDDLVGDAYGEAVARENVEPIGRPQVEILDLEPVRFKAIVPVKPTVELGDYSTVRLSLEPTPVTEEMVEEQLLALRRRRALYVPVDRPIQWNDIVTADVQGSTAEGETFIDDEAAEFILREGQTLLLPGLAEAFLGMSKGESKELELEVPEDFSIERFRGKRIRLSLAVREVKEEQLPELDDEFAQQIDAEEFPTLEALRTRIRKELEDAFRREAEEKLRLEALDKLVEISKLEYPDLLVEHEIDHMIREMAGDDRQAFLAELRRIGKSEAEFRASLREAAARRVERALVFDAFAEREGIEVSDEEVTAEVERLAGDREPERSRFIEVFSDPRAREAIRNQLYRQKAFERLQAIVTGSDGAPAAAEEASA
ncbi:MAG: trigger factor [Chloroflexota bacterium]|nr:trigger factor [Dehalococcoidia bacterium]MDW8045885.1 trigger factor [Chloroflexota bacterium]